VYRGFVKPVIDFVGALISCVLLSWLILIVVVIYKAFGFRNIFFKHERIGASEKPFMLIKFRTLLEDETLPLLERRFWLGDFLRRTSLDELPQLINVLRGEMSLVGPRPLPAEYLTLYNNVQRRRHEVRPGITGLAQVSGRTTIPWAKKFELDVWYVQHVSFMLDVKIILKTLLLLLQSKSDLSLTEQPFTGNP
jgi:undecaprenyl phosphate N,N'-diacetylbacillosamine 1-phosphate transferase